MEKLYKPQQIKNLFGASISREAFLKAEESKSIPKAKRQQHGSISTRVWSTDQLPRIGERYGFLKKIGRPTVLTVFTTKGGVLKTSIALNIARTAALHNIKTLIVGLDVQCDITSALGFYNFDENADFEEALQELDSTQGLGPVFAGKVDVSEVIQKTDLPTLDLIPETAELVSLDRAISAKPRREYWLKEKITDPLKEKYDLIILDCSPNWSHLISNAIVACDFLISPIECQINQFRNLKVFQALASEFKTEMNLSYEHIFVPTRFTAARKISTEIRSWYLANVDGVTHSVLRDCVQGEESMAMHLSFLEYQPKSLPSDEMREFLKELWGRLAHKKRARAVA